MRILDAERRRRVLRFVGVGATAAALNSAVFYLLLANNLDYRLAGVAAFYTGVQWSFVLNRRFTFTGHTGGWQHQLLVFNLVYSLGFLVYEASLILLHGWFGIWWLPANLAAILLAGTVNYLGAEQQAFGVR